MSALRIFCVANQKGGVGKTTTCINLAAGLAQLGRRVLLVDLDPQGNATMGSGIDKRALELSVYDVLLESATVAEARQVPKALFRGPKMQRHLNQSASLAASLSGFFAASASDFAPSSRPFLNSFWA